MLEKTVQSPLDCKEIQSVNPKGNQPEYSLEGPCWSWNSNTLATCCKELTPWKRPWCLQRLKAGGEGDNGGWDGRMTSLTQWTWFWVNSGSCWWMGKPDMLHSMGSQRVGHNWATKLNWCMVNDESWSKGFCWGGIYLVSTRFFLGLYTQVYTLYEICGDESITSGIWALPPQPPLSCYLCTK